MFSLHLINKAKVEKESAETVLRELPVAAKEHVFPLRAFARDLFQLGLFSLIFFVCEKCFFFLHHHRVGAERTKSHFTICNQNEMLNDSSLSRFRCLSPQPMRIKISDLQRSTKVEKTCQSPPTARLAARHGFYKVQLSCGNLQASTRSVNESSEQQCAAQAVVAVLRLTFFSICSYFWHWAKMHLQHY